MEEEEMQFMLFERYYMQQTFLKFGGLEHKKHVAAKFNHNYGTWWKSLSISQINAMN